MKAIKSAKISENSDYMKQNLFRSFAVENRAFTIVELCVTILIAASILYFTQSFFISGVKHSISITEYLDSIDQANKLIFSIRHDLLNCKSVITPDDSGNPIEALLSCGSPELPSSETTVYPSMLIISIGDNATISYQINFQKPDVTGVARIEEEKKISDNSISRNVTWFSVSKIRTFKVIVLKNTHKIENVGMNTRHLYLEMEVCPMKKSGETDEENKRKSAKLINTISPNSLGYSTWNYHLPTNGERITTP
ncbi:MAG: hypothetical protein HQM10_25100 [Candidatus Riflebacteria bacterium]|nr:hypothetical protein [Candidatus Riflebacteria bacterium]